MRGAFVKDAKPLQTTGGWVWGEFFGDRVFVGFGCFGGFVFFHRFFSVGFAVGFPWFSWLISIFWRPKIQKKPT